MDSRLQDFYFCYQRLQLNRGKGTFFNSADRSGDNWGGCEGMGMGSVLLQDCESATKGFNTAVVDQNNTALYRHISTYLSTYLSKDVNIRYNVM